MFSIVAVILELKIPEDSGIYPTFQVPVVITSGTNMCLWVYLFQSNNVLNIHLV
jgi:hypothetical protein